VVSSALALFLPIPSYREIPRLSNEIKALVTLFIGVFFFLMISSWAGSGERSAFILRWVNWGGLAIIVWSVLQSYFWNRQEFYPDWMNTAQTYFSVPWLYQARVTGFAFEPSWLAHQLNMLYLPFWLAAAVRGTTVHRLRLGPITLERLLLVGGIVTLWLSVSRIGLLGFVMMVVFLLLLGCLNLVRWLQRLLLKRSLLSGWRLRLARAGVTIGLLVGLLLISLGLLFGVGYVLSRVDIRMKNLFNPQTLTTLRTQNFAHYANQLVFAERFIFWQTGWEVFNDYPVIGVGLGNAGYFFMQKLSPFAWALTEVRTLMYQQQALPNTKSLWSRILAETGILGMACFVSWLFGLWISANWLRRACARNSLAGTIGLAGMCVLIGLLAEGFSVDTFALPYYWVSLGLVAAVFTWNVRHEGELK
jgi:hypothetical protein